MSTVKDSGLEVWQHAHENVSSPKELAESVSFEYVAAVVAESVHELQFMTPTR